MLLFRDEIQSAITISQSYPLEKKDLLFTVMTAQMELNDCRRNNIKPAKPSYLSKK